MPLVEKPHVALGYKKEGNLTHANIAELKPEIKENCCSSH